MGNRPFHREIDLSGEWSLTWSKPGAGIEAPSDLESDGVEWIPATVPGEVHFDILGEEEAERLFNGFLVMGDWQCWAGLSASEHGWIEKTDFWYRRSFDLDPEALSGDTRLVFEGIDCFGTVWLNGTLIGSTRNALVRHDFELDRGLLRRRDNELVVGIESTLNTLLSDPDVRLDCEKYLSFDPLHTMGRHLARYVRRCFQSSYLVLGPGEASLLPTGLWRGVRLVSRRGAKMADVWARARITDMAARESVTARLDLEVTVDGQTQDEALELDVSLRDGRGETVFATKRAVEGERTEIGAVLKGIHPWCPHNVGTPCLYDLSVTLSGREGVADRFEDRIGFRDVELVLEEDGENRYYFKINGEKVVIKGAVLTLTDFFQFREDETRYRECLEKVKGANMNAVLMVSSDVYKEKAFFDICDELGLMVRYCFPVCGVAHPTERFRKELREEVRRALRAVRNHPCIVTWAGSGESYGYSGVNWVILRRACRELAPDMPYVPANPWSPPGTVTGEDIARMRRNHGIVPYWNTDFDADFHPLVLEWISPASGSTEGFADTSLMCFGFANTFSLPAPGTLRRTCSERKMEALRSRYLTDEILSTEYREKIVPPLMHPELDLESADDVALLSQLVQAHRMRTDIELIRRREECGGGGMWCFNQWLPDVYFGIVDYHLRPKAAYYYVKRAYENLLVLIYGRPPSSSLTFHGGSHYSSFLVRGEPRKEVWVVNDHRRPVRGRLAVTQRSFTGAVRWSEERDVSVRPASTTKVYEFPLTGEILRHRRTDFISVTLSSEDGLEAGNTYFIGEFRELELPRAVLAGSRRKVAEDGDHVRIALELGADAYAAVVTVEPAGGGPDVEPSDNYFDIRPGETATVELRMRKGEENAALRVKALNSDILRL